MTITFGVKKADEAEFLIEVFSDGASAGCVGVTPDMSQEGVIDHRFMFVDLLSRIMFHYKSDQSFISLDQASASIESIVVTI